MLTPRNAVTYKELKMLPPTKTDNGTWGLVSNLNFNQGTIREPRDL